MTSEDSNVYIYTTDVQRERELLCTCYRAIWLTSHARSCFSALLSNNNFLLFFCARFGSIRSKFCNAIQNRKMSLPSSSKKSVVKKNSSDILDSIGVVTDPMPVPKPDEVLVKNRFVGVNASDLNATVSKGTYDGEVPPFGIGLEGVGEIVAIGSNVQSRKVGQAVAYLSRTAFAEYVVLGEKDVIPIPKASREFIPVLICGMTAAIGLDKQGHIKPGDKVLITAAAGGTGHIAVQWAKQAGCHVIGTCSSEEKAEFLKSIGCDRPINYKKEDLSEVLSREYSDGVDVIWETIGGETFKMLYGHLAVKGRMIIVGAITSYNSDGFFGPVQLDDFPKGMLFNCVSISGFYLLKYKTDYRAYLTKLVTMQAEGKLKVTMDMGVDTPEGKFVGVDSVARAMQYMYLGKNTGKIVITLPE